MGRIRPGVALVGLVVTAITFIPSAAGAAPFADGVAGLQLRSATTHSQCDLGPIRELQQRLLQRRLFLRLGGRLGAGPRRSDTDSHNLSETPLGSRKKSEHDLLPPTRNEPFRTLSRRALERALVRVS